MWACQAMKLWKKKPSARLMAISTTIPRVSRRRRHAVKRAGDRVLGVPEHREVPDDARADPGHQEHHHVNGQQRPGDDGAGDRGAAEGGPGLAGAPRALAYALYALLAHRGRAHA